MTGIKMVNLDLKDRKILYHLDLNCRQSNAQIGKKVGLSKQVVDYRIKRMEEEGIIENYWTAIDTFKLGYQVLRIYLNFQDVNNEIKNKIIEHFINYKYIWSVASKKGPFDFSVVLWVNNINEFYHFWKKTLLIFEKYFVNHSVSIYIQSCNYIKSFLLPDVNIKSNRKMYETICTGKTVTIDEIDLKILNEIAVNARVPFINLAKKFNCSSQAVNYRIKNLIKNNIIQAFRINIDYSKLGFHNYKLDIYLKKYSQRDSIINHLEKKSNMLVLNVAVGWADIEPELVVKNIDELNEIHWSSVKTF